MTKCIRSKITRHLAMLRGAKKKTLGNGNAACHMSILAVTDESGKTGLQVYRSRPMEVRVSSFEL